MPPPRAPINVVFQWNRSLETNVPAAAPPAMFDAINTIEQVYTPFHVHLQPGWGGASEVAAAQAAHDVLVALIPAGASVLDALLSQQARVSAKGQLKELSWVRRWPDDFSFENRPGQQIGAQVADYVYATGMTPR